MNSSMLLLRLRSTFLLLAVLTTPAIAQDDIFGAGANPFETDPAVGDQAGIFGAAPAPPPVGQAAAGPSSTELETNAIVLMVRENPPQTPKEMARAIYWLEGLERYDEISRLFNGIQTSGWGRQQYAEMARAAGAVLLLRLQSEAADKLSAEHQQLLSDISKAPSQLAKDPTWIDGWIDQLSSEQPGQRRLALLKLQDAKEAGVARMIARLHQGAEKALSVGIVKALVAQGDPAVEALKLGLDVDDQAQAGNLALALAEADSRLFAAEIAAAIHGSIVAPDVQTQIVDFLAARYAAVPDADKSLGFLKQRFTDALASYQLVRTAGSEVDVPSWHLNAVGDGVERVAVPSSVSKLESAAHVARLLLAMPVDRQLQTQCLAVVLQRVSRFDAGQRELALERVLERYLSNDDGAALVIAAREQADAMQMHGGSLEAVRLLASGRVAPPLQHLELLSDLLGDTRPQFRYEALSAIAAIDPTLPFAGAEKSMAVAVEMTQLGAGSAALVIGLHADLTQAAAQQIEALEGGRVLSANSAKSAFRLLTSDIPFELVFVVDRVSDQSLFELLQRIRNGRASRDLPIAVLTDQLYPHERKLIEELPGVVQSVLSRNVEQMQRILVRIREQVDTPMMDAGDRARYSQVGTNFLARISGDRDKYAIYPIGDLRTVLAGADLTLNSRERASMLSGLGTADSQRQLLRLAADLALDEADRLHAAAKFETSVNQFGLRFDRDTTMQVYELYNALGPTDPISVKSLGRILDTIEQYGL